MKLFVLYKYLIDIYLLILLFNNILYKKIGNGEINIIKNIL